MPIVFAPVIVCAEALSTNPAASGVAVAQLVPLAVNTLPEVAVVVPNVAPFIFATVLVSESPVTSPASVIVVGAVTETNLELVAEPSFTQKTEPVLVVQQMGATKPALYYFQIRRPRMATY